MRLHLDPRLDLRQCMEITAEFVRRLAGCPSLQDLRCSCPLPSVAGTAELDQDRWNEVWRELQLPGHCDYWTPMQCLDQLRLQGGLPLSGGRTHPLVTPGATELDLGVSAPTMVAVCLQGDVFLSMRCLREV